MNSISQVVAFVRPWEVHFMVGLARELAASYGVPIRYLTMWKAVEKRISSELAGNEEIVFVPAKLAESKVGPEGTPGLIALEDEMARRCGTPIKTMLDAERFRPKQGKAAMAFMWRHLAVFDEIIPERAILLSNQVDHLCYWLACDLTRLRGGEFFGFSSSGRPSLCTQVSRSATGLWAPYAPGKQHYEIAEQQRRDIIAGVKPAYMNPNRLRRPLWAKIGHRISLCEEMAAGNYFAHPSDLLQGRDPQARLNWMHTRSVVKTSSVSEIGSRPFVYLPLHLEPEATTWVYAPLVRNQAYVIDAVAKSMPGGVDLVVKENPKMWGKRSTRFYLDAQERAGVIWAAFDAPSEQLIRNSIGVVTIAGTAAVEAMLLGKPALLLGKPPFVEALRSLPRMGRIEDLPKMLERLVEQKGRVDHEEDPTEYATYVANLIPRPFVGSTELEGESIPMVPYSSDFAKFVRDALELSASGCECKTARA